VVPHGTFEELVILVDLFDSGVRGDQGVERWIEPLDRGLGLRRADSHGHCGKKGNYEGFHGNPPKANIGQTQADITRDLILA
jgi:hypothetical protein